MEQLSHYHLLIINSAAHASLLPLLDDASWVKPLLHDKLPLPEEREHLVCVAIAHVSFAQILEDLEAQVALFAKVLHLPKALHYVSKQVRLPLDVPGLRLDFTNKELAQKVLDWLSKDSIDPITIGGDIPYTPTINNEELAPTPGYSFLNPTALKFLPYR